jgi:hypothetical protein
VSFIQKVEKLTKKKYNTKEQIEHLNTLSKGERFEHFNSTEV